MAEINKIAYAKEMAAYLSPDNAFYKKSRLITEAADAKTFEIPQLGKPGDVHEGEPDSLPVQIKLATDGKRVGNMVQIWGDPIAITSESEIVTNYSKRQNHQQQQAAQIETKVADLAAYAWCPTTSGLIVPTTGDGRASNVTGISGNRKSATKTDILKIIAILRRANIAGISGKMYGLVTDDIYTDLLGISDFVDYIKLGVESKLTLGVVGKILGVEIMTRNNEYNHTGVILNASTGKLKNPTTAASDRPASIFWHEGLVVRGEAPLQVSINQAPAGYLGATIIESWRRFGADHVRDDFKGTAVLAEAVSQ